MDKKNSLFREESQKKLTDPEQLNEYVKIVSTPIWLILIAVIIIFAGMFIFASTAKLETKIPALIEVTDEGSYVFYASNYLDNVKCDQTVRAANSSDSYTILVTDNTLISKWRYFNSSDYDDVISTDWFFAAEISDTGLSNGYYRGYIVTGTYNPISFLIH